MARLAFAFRALLLFLVAECLRRNREEQRSITPVFKNAKQKAWAAASILNLEHKKCGRHNYPVSHKAKWPWQSCPEGWNKGVFSCRTCHGGDEGAFACWEKCGAEVNLPQLPVGCTNMFCVGSKTDCVRVVTKAVVTWGSFAYDLISNRSALEEASSALGSVKDAAVDGVGSLKEVARDGKQLVTTVLKDTVDKLVADTRQRLVDFIGGKTPSEDTREAVIRGGAELVALQAAGMVNEKIKAIADKVLAAADFSGVPGFRKALEAFDGGERCRDVMLTPMPEDGIETEDASEDASASVTPTPEDGIETEDASASGTPVPEDGIETEDASASATPMPEDGIDTEDASASE